LETTTQQLSDAKQRLESLELQIQAYHTSLEQKNMSYQAAVQQLNQVEKQLEDTKCQTKTREATLKAEVALLKAQMEEKDTELRQFQDQPAQGQCQQLDKEREALKVSLLNIISAAGAAAPSSESGALDVYVNCIGGLLQQKSKEITELVGYCTKLLDQKEESPK
jgi:chromosome segregation ATPase